MSQLDELVLWLREQIAAVRETACDAIVRKSGGDEWGVGEIHIPSWSNRDERDTEVIGGGKPIVQCNYEYGGPMIAAHIAEHDPRAVLAQCEAHTAILDQWKGLAKSPPEMPGIKAIRVEMEYVLRAVALAYRHRPGYREEWTP